MAEEGMVYASLKLVNKIISKLKCFDFLSQTALHIVKGFYLTESEHFKIEIIIFLSQLSKLKPEYSH